MSENFESEDSFPGASEAQDVVVLIKKMQQQLTFLEKKIDLLINKIGEGSGRDRHFSKSSRSFERHHRSFDRGSEGRSGEKNFGHRRHFKKGHSGEDREFDRQEKKGDNFHQEGDFNKDRHFKKRHDGERRAFYQKGKPFSHKRKGHQQKAA